jgi:hypothetical protein
MTQPLLPTREDPAIQRGYAIQEALTAALAQARVNTQASDLAIAETVAHLYGQAVQDLAAARDDYNQRRSARIAELEQIVPIGPNVPADASPVDSAALHDAFRTALEAARVADRDTRTKKLDDAIRFGDDVQLRAVLTASADDGQQTIIDRWAATKPALKEQLAELLDLRSHGVADLFASQAFRIPPKPQEIFDLPMLRAAAAQSAAMAATFNSPMNNAHRVTAQK